MATQIPVRLLVAGIVWIIVAAGLAWRLSLFPRYTYQSLQEGADTFKLPPRKWWYSFSDPSLWIVLLMAGGVSISIRYMTIHPIAGILFYRRLAGVVIWLRDGDSARLLVVPWIIAWVLLAIITAFHAVRVLATLLIFELLLKIAPGCVMYRSRMHPGRWRKQFDKEWRKEHAEEKMTVEQTLAAALAFGTSMMGIYNDYPYFLIVGLFGFGGAFFALRYTQGKKQRQELETEISRRFDPLKLLSENRRSLWRQTLKNCVIWPGCLLFATGVWTFYTFESDGIVAHRWEKNILTPWADVSALRLQIRPPTESKHSSKGDEVPPPELQVTVLSPHGDIELDDGGALIGFDTLLLDALLAKFKRQNIPIICGRNEDGLKLLKEYLYTKKAVNNAPYVQKLKFIAALCVQT